MREHGGNLIVCTGIAGMLLAAPGHATDTTLPAVQVNAIRMDIPPFDLPASLSVVAVAPADAGLPGVNLSETLVGAPGILARGRQNYAQDEQISIRGYGARATFGVRSIRLYVDGIPATLPDGQGQIAHFNLDSAERVEVLRGPFSVLYGNAAGGVVQVWSADGTPTPVTTLGINAGSNDTFRYSANTRGTVGAVDYNIAVSEFLSGGYRQHSRVLRESDNAKFGVDLGKQRRLTLVLNRYNQPTAQDPLGLTRAQVDADPRQATAVAGQYDTRKSGRQTQFGAIYEQSFDAGDQLRLLAYSGQRRIVQYLSIPPGTQQNPLQSGGVVAPTTRYGGLDARWTHRGELAGGGYEFVLGASGDYQRQHRLGYENFAGDALGVIGRLRRNENDNVDSVAGYAQWYWRFSERWALLLGLRHDDVRFSEHDFYVTALNPDDSGHANYAATTPVAALDFRPTDALRIYVSYGKGFETPSFNELGYRSDGRAGLAFDLRPAHSRHLEAGAKWQATRALEFDLAAFRSDTDDELAVATNVDGRATYQNAGNARRQGIELSLTGQLADAWQISAGLTHLQARFRSTFFTCLSAPCAEARLPVTAGSRIPGVPDNYGSLRFQHGRELGWREGLTLSGVGSVTVNDIDSQRAAGYGLLDADVSYTFALTSSARLQLSARVNNLTDRRHIGSVIVNDGNGRYFEPGPARTWMLGARLVF
ncbi:TonB-dependent receptor family protein [Rhodanobacter soli]|uniref:TonB-dependent receptor family protein n=1 Tax=Rhodanobacter soli TaxID=590609 RepID=UPI0031DFA90F